MPSHALCVMVMSMLHIQNVASFSMATPVPSSSPVSFPHVLGTTFEGVVTVDGMLILPFDDMIVNMHSRLGGDIGDIKFKVRNQVRQRT